MNINKTNNLSFNGFYKIRGSNEVLDEVGWYLKKVWKKEGSNFDFLQIRANKQPLMQSDFGVQPINFLDIKEAKLPDLGEHLDAIISRVFQAPIADLFLTNSHREKFLQHWSDISTIATEEALRYISSGTQKVKRLVDTAFKLRKQVDSREIVTEINPKIIEELILAPESKTITVLEGDAVIEGMQKGTFDFIKGVIA